MGMVPHLIGRWNKVNADYLANNRRASDAAGGSWRNLQGPAADAAVGRARSWRLPRHPSRGLGWNHHRRLDPQCPGSRACRHCHLPIGEAWLAARQSWDRLRRLLAMVPPETEPMPLQPPHKSLVVENANVVPPGEQKPVVRDLSLKLQRGNGLGVIGPSASGKSSLARMLVGYWAPTQGKVCLDGASLHQWAPHLLGRSIGYLPQHVELLTGTVAQNISRFEPDARPTAIRAAAAIAGVHDMIVSLPNGYDTQIGEQAGSALGGTSAAHSAGPRALSRSIPGGSRRAQFQSRCRRRCRIDASHSQHPRARRHRGRDRPPPKCNRRSGSPLGDERGTRGSLRAQR